MPSSRPTEPPMAADRNSVFSFILHAPRLAFHLSMPQSRKAIRLMAARYMKKYFLKYLPLFMIGIIANIVVDYVQLYIPEYLGDMVEIVSSKEGVIFADIKSITASA